MLEPPLSDALPSASACPARTLQVMEYAADWSDALKSIADDFSWLYAAPAPASDAPAPAAAGVAVAEIVDERKDSKDVVVRF